jgi:uncharacterized protein
MKAPIGWTHPPIETWTQGGPVNSVIDASQVEQLESTVEARIGDATALGFFAFAIGTTVIAWVLCGWAALPTSLIAAVPVALIFAGTAEFIAGLYSFSRTHSWCGTVLCTYGAGYAAIGAYIWMQAAGVIPRLPGDMLLAAIGLFCICYMSLAFAIGANRLNWAYMLVTGLMFPGFGLMGVQFLGAGREAGFIGGYFMLAAAFFAFYAATAHVVNSAWGQAAFPLGSRRMLAVPVRQNNPTTTVRP